MKNITIEKQTEIENNVYKITKKRHRIVAFLIDFFILWILAMILGFFFGKPLENEIGFHMTGLPAFVVMFFGTLLWPISEGIWGQTIGKRILGIEVVTNEFNQICIGQAFVRFFFGFIDYILLIGLIIASTNKQNKRIGDMVADTIVVRKKKTYTQNHV